jgi:hypothetical protein
MKELLIESAKFTKKMSGIDPTKPGNFKRVILDDRAFASYVKSLSEGLNKNDAKAFTLLAENTRQNLLENSMFQINPYEVLTLPILRVFYPKLVAKEAVTVSPIDKPEAIKTFITATFTRHGENEEYGAPAMPSPARVGISGGPAVGTPVAATMNVPSTTNVLAILNLTDADAHLERDFVISGVSDGTTWVDTNIVPDVEGRFSQAVTIGTSSDVLVGVVNYLKGTVSISSTTGVVTRVRYSVTCSLEENKVNPKTKLYADKVRLYAKDRQISTEWSINLEQDLRALLDLSVQAELVNLLGQQIALDIDREIIDSLSTANSMLNPSSHTDTFSKTPPAGYAWGQKYWFENILPKLNALSAQVYNDTNIGAANVILCNPLDASIFESLNGFAYTGTSDNDGDVGYRAATVAGGKWRILTSSVVPSGKMILIYKPVEEMKAIYFYAPYVPAILHPYPLGPKPSLTILSRYATALVRVAGIAALTITT